MSVIDKILAFIEKHLPWFLGGYYAGKQSSDKESGILRAQLIKIKLKMKRARYEQKIKDRNRSLANDQLANEINSRTRNKK